MPRKGPGGARQGKVGGQYSNRSDLRQAKPFVGQEYGTATAQAQSLSQVPVTGPPQQGLVEAMSQASVPPPGSLGSFGRPTETTDPVTHGLPSGPGAGPEVLSTGTDDSVAQLKHIYMLFPNPDLRSLIEQAEGRG